MEFSINLSIYSVYVKTDGYFLRYEIYRDKEDSHLFHLKYKPSRYDVEKCEYRVPDIDTCFFYSEADSEFKIGKYLNSGIVLMPQIVFIDVNKAWEENKSQFPECQDSREWILENEYRYFQKQEHQKERILIGYDRGNTKTYIIHDPYGKKYKIGKSVNPLKRLKSFCDPSFYLYAVHPEDVEYQMHGLFYDKRIRGEWFNLDKNDLDILISKGFIKVI